MRFRDIKPLLGVGTLRYAMQIDDDLWIGNSYLAAIVERDAFRRENAGWLPPIDGPGWAERRDGQTWKDVPAPDLRASLPTTRGALLTNTGWTWTTLVSLPKYGYGRSRIALMSGEKVVMADADLFAMLNRLYPFCNLHQSRNGIIGFYREAGEKLVAILMPCRKGDVDPITITPAMLATIDETGVD